MRAYMHDVCMYVGKQVCVRICVCMCARERACDQRLSAEMWPPCKMWAPCKMLRKKEAQLHSLQTWTEYNMEPKK